ncbi:hypothetical protein FB192DRAFT_1435484 [Mucor lusitanicus]|uniref:Uncharacterized protein n=1 Tax=Mucor circinelloides f. lusitanicus TaxID=29924 RepID=A0A8H4BLH9_MUCCL|nr:hypothetical protein FB192DRAFT_1435484 [Mucor lusitanicus]
MAIEIDDLFFIVHKRANHRNLFSNNSHSSSSSTSGQTAFTAASPMELGAINEYKPLSASVKDFRRASGLCMYCVEANHQVSSCPKKRKKAVGSLSTIVLPE